MSRKTRTIGGIAPLFGTKNYEIAGFHGRGCGDILLLQRNPSCEKSIQRGRIACLQALALQFWRDGTENSHIIKCAKAGMQAVAALDHGELSVGLPHQKRRIGALMTVVFAV